MLSVRCWGVRKTGIAKMRDDSENFRCQRCGSCCRVPGYVKVTEAEIDAIAEYIGIELYEFISTYTRITHNRQGLSLIERDDHACVFLGNDNECLIERVKPKQCRQFPFDWKYDDMSGICPGWKSSQK